MPYPGFLTYPSYPGYPSKGNLRPHRNDDADRDIWYDKSGYGRNATLTGWTWVDGDRWDGAGTPADPYCLECAGVNTQMVTCSGGGPTGDFSLDVWARIDNVSDNYGMLIGREYNGPSGWGLYGRQGLVAAFLVTSTPSDRIQTPYLAGDFTSWHHFAATFDRDGYLRLYLDGQYQSQVDISSKAGLDLSTRHPWLFAYSGWTFQGAEAAAREYNRVLSDAEVAQNFAAGPHGKNYVKDSLQLDLNAGYARS